jgi:fermentation-respiration switch protein FrsA (DUF1100 family)
MKLWWAFALRAFRTVLLIYLAVLVLAYFLQRRLQYFPDADPVEVPVGPQFHGLREITLQAEDKVRLKAWYWPGREPLTLLILHGNAGSREHRLGWGQALHDRGWGVFILDYRGYGGSSGSPSEVGFLRDARAAWNWLRGQTEDRVALVGESIGTGVAIQLAAETDPLALIVQSPFASAVEVGQASFPLLPIGWILKDRFESVRHISHVSCPVLVIHGEQDELIPLAQARRLFRQAAEPKVWYCVPGAGHNDLLDVAGTQYLEVLSSFLDSARRTSGDPEPSPSGPDG